jgi:hypothetical protein
VPVQSESGISILHRCLIDHPGLMHVLLCQCTTIIPEEVQHIAGKNTNVARDYKRRTWYELLRAELEALPQCLSSPNPWLQALQSGLDGQTSTARPCCNAGESKQQKKRQGFRGNLAICKAAALEALYLHLNQSARTVRLS